MTDRLPHTRIPERLPAYLRGTAFWLRRKAKLGETPAQLMDYKARSHELLGITQALQWSEDLPLAVRRRLARLSSALDNVLNERGPLSTVTLLKVADDCSRLACDATLSRPGLPQSQGPVASAGRTDYVPSL